MKELIFWFGSGAASRVAAATVVVAAATLVGAALAGCSKTESPAPTASASAAVSASASAAYVPRVPQAIDPEAVKQAVNPKGSPPYTGPTGAVAGVVRVTGGTAPTRDEVLAKIKNACADSRSVYGPLFREGPERALADALVTVTGYQGYLPEKDEAVRVVARRCAWERRTLAATFGQRVEVLSKDGEPYMPKLLGGPNKAMMVAIPGGDAVKLYPTKPGRYALTDAIHEAMFADVFVLQYPTHAVTGLDGRYRIEGIPVGEVNVNALMPQTMQTAGKKVEIKAGETAEVDLEIHFAPEKTAPAAATGSGAPVIH